MSKSIEYLGQYELTERLASGGMGELFVGRRVSDDERVVLKLMQPEDSLGKRRNRLRAFLNEARVMTLLDHANIVRIYEIDFDQGSFYMAMEYLVGWSLAQVMNRLSERQQVLPFDVVIGLVIDACRGLHYAHEATTAEGLPLELVHRDVHHGNLFVTADGGMKVLDFGISKSSIQLEQTRIGLVKGTAGYMSPEQCHSRPLDRRSDIFTLGIVLHELLTGRRLYSGTMMEGMIAITSQAAMPPSRQGESLPESLVAICMRTLQQDPGMRYPSAEALAKDLEDVARQMHLLISPSHVVSEMNTLFRDSAGGFSVEATAPIASAPQLKAWAQTVVEALVSSDSFESDIETDRMTPWDAISDDTSPIAFDGNEWPCDSTQIVAPATEDLTEHSIREAQSQPESSISFARLLLVAVGVLLGAGTAVLVAYLTLHESLMPAIADDPVPVDAPTLDDVSTSVDAPTLDDVSTSVDAPTLDDVSTSVEVPTLEDIGGDLHDSGSRDARENTAKPLAESTDRKAKVQATAVKAQRPKKDRALRPTRRPPRKPAVAMGKLTLEAVPWAKVYFAGKLLGTTPLVNQALPAGPQKLRLVNPQGGIDETVTVEIPVGGALRKKLTLR